MVTAVAHYVPLTGELKHKDIMATAAVDLVLQLTKCPFYPNIYLLKDTSKGVY